MLTYSSLSDKDVGALCSALRRCTLLASLSLSYNGLESQGVAELSHSLLPHLRALTSLDLSHNGCGGWAHNAYSAPKPLPPHLQVRRESSSQVGPHHTSSAPRPRPPHLHSSANPSTRYYFASLIVSEHMRDWRHVVSPCPLIRFKMIERASIITCRYIITCVTGDTS